MTKVRWAGWLEPKHLAWLRKKALAQEVETTPSKVLRSVIDKAMKTEEKRKWRR